MMASDTRRAYERSAPMPDHMSRSTRSQLSEQAIKRMASTQSTDVRYGQSAREGRQDGSISVATWQRMSGKRTCLTSRMTEHRRDDVNGRRMTRRISKAPVFIAEILQKWVAVHDSAVVTMGSRSSMYG